MTVKEFFEMSDAEFARMVDSSPINELVLRGFLDSGPFELFGNPEQLSGNTGKLHDNKANVNVQEKTMDGVEIKKITVRVGERELEFTEDEARQLFMELNKLFGARDVYIPYVPYTPLPYEPCPTYPIITWCWLDNLPEIYTRV